MSDVRTLSVRLRPEAYGELEERAREEGMTLAAFARDRLFGGSADASQLKELHAEIAEVKSLLESLLRRNGK